MSDSLSMGGTVTGLPYTYYRTCDTCAHVAPVASADDLPYRCENCGASAAWEYRSLTKAEQHSQDILDRLGRKAAS